MMTSLVQSHWQVVLSQGICIGIGMGCLLIPSVGAPGMWFQKRRGLAIGLVTTGSAVAGIIFPIALDRLIGEVGFPWAVRSQVETGMKARSFGAVVPFFLVQF